MAEDPSKLRNCPLSPPGDASAQSPWVSTSESASNALKNLLMMRNQRGIDCGGGRGGSDGTVCWLFHC